MEKQDLTFKVIEFVVEHLKKNVDVKFNSRQLAEEITASHPLQSEHKMAKSKQSLDKDRLILQVQAQIGASWRRIAKKSEHIVITAERPMLFYWSSEPQMEEAQNAADQISQTAINQVNEASLYPLVRDYCSQEKNVYCMRIDEKRSKGKGGSGSSHWLHPDLVGIQLLSEEWGVEAQPLSKFYAQELIKLWSFEVKTSLSMSNVRSAFFQTVSNSSWAHYGYLVAEKIDQRALEEVEPLAAAHGIGILLLNSTDVSNSSVLIPARERTVLSWPSINRLAEENRDFAEFLKSLERLHQTGDMKLVARQFDLSFKV